MLREAPQLQKPLIDGVRNGWHPKSASAPVSVPPPEPEAQSSVQLSAKAARALGKWGASGFRKLDPAEFEARWATCQACPNLTAAPHQIVYQGLKILGSEDQSICGKCGCTAKAKARLSTETCPDIDPDAPTRTRSGQPLPAHTAGSQLSFSPDHGSGSVRLGGTRKGEGRGGQIGNEMKHGDLKLWGRVGVV